MSLITDSATLGGTCQTARQEEEETPELFILGKANTDKHTNLGVGAKLAAWHEASQGSSDDALIIIIVD